MAKEKKETSFEDVINNLYKDISSLREEISKKELEIKVLLKGKKSEEIPLHVQLKANREADNNIKKQKMIEQIELIQNIARG